MRLYLVLDGFDLIGGSDCQLKAVLLDAVVDFGPADDLRNSGSQMSDVASDVEAKCGSRNRPAVPWKLSPDPAAPCLCSRLFQVAASWQGDRQI